MQEETKPIPDPVEDAFAALKEGVFLKPIAGAAMGDEEKIERWSEIHTAAGATALDVRYEPRCIEAARRGRERARARLGDEAGWPLIMASITPDGDVHTLKAKVEPDLCKPCPACVNVCPDDALVLPAEGPIELLYDRCRGCDRCVEVCPTGALSMEKIAEGEFVPRLRATLAAGAEAIEIHASALPNRELDQVLRDYDTIATEDVLLSICIGSLAKAPREVYESLEIIRERRSGRRTMIQADGKTMGERPGGLMALALAELILDSKIRNSWVVASGGVTPAAWDISTQLGLEIGGIGLGILSYKLIQDYVFDPRLTTDDDFLREAALVAKKLHRQDAAGRKRHKGLSFAGPAAARIGGRRTGKRRGTSADDQAFNGDGDTTFGESRS